VLETLDAVLEKKSQCLFTRFEVCLLRGQHGRLLVKLSRPLSKVPARLPKEHFAL
jgi:hypothetical protein